jgi:hypothetical protein
MPRDPAVAVEYSHHASEGICQVFILTDTATAAAHATELASHTQIGAGPLSGTAARVESLLFEGSS